MIEVDLWPDLATRSNRGVTWCAETMVAGERFTARSKSGATHELARVLVAAGIPDAPMVVYEHRDPLAERKPYWTFRYGSFHATAMLTLTEGDKTLIKLKRWEDPDVVVARKVAGIDQNRG